MSRSNFLGPIFAMGLIAAVTGCASTGTPEGEIASELKKSEARIANLEREVNQRENRIETLQSELATASKLPAVSAAPNQSVSGRFNQMPGGDLLPPGAQPGECYSRVFVPAKYETRTEEVLASGATESISVIPAKYETVDEQVLVEAASSRIEVIPAKLGWVEEQVLVKAASTRLEQVPAQYEWQEEQVLVSPAQTVWKPGRGPVEKVSSATGEIMCLVEIPAEYKTVRRKIQTAPPTTREIAIPAEYRTVKKQVVTTPPSTRTIEIPAKYKTVKVRKVVEPSREVRTPIEAKYQTVSKRVQVSDGEMAWREILCETNTTPDVIRRLQAALDKAGHNPGPIDGVIGTSTLAALKSYQTQKGLAKGGLTLATLKSLGVSN